MASLDRYLVIPHQGLSYDAQRIKLPRFSRPGLSELIAIRQAMPDLKPSLAERIERLRDELNINYSTLAELFDVNRAPLHAWRNGTSGMNEENLLQLEHLEQIAMRWKELTDAKPLALPVRKMLPEGTVIECLRRQPLQLGLLEQLVPIAHRDLERTRTRRPALDNEVEVLRPEPKN